MDDGLIKRILPHSTEAEQSVIGSMLMDKEAIAIASEMLQKEDFYGKQYGILFEAMVDLYNQGRPVDPVTLQNRLKEMNVPAEISSMEFVREAVSVVPHAVNVKQYATIVSEKATLRRLIRINEEVENVCYAESDSTQNILDHTEKQIFDVIQRRNAGDYTPIDEVVMEVLEKINIAAQTSGNVTGIPTGFTDLDYKLAGLQPSDLILIAARPSMGKTSLALNILQHICFKQGRCAAIFSLEMSKEQLVNRLMSLESHVEASLIRTGDLSEQDWDGLVESAGVIGHSKLIIDDTPGISINELRSKCRKYKLEQNMEVVFIDYLQLMVGGGRADSRQQEISEISRSLKALARELNVPVIALSQLSRAVEKRDDHRPMLSDLRESGAIEQDADVVMFLYREDYYNKETEKKNITEVIIAKQRNGPIGTCDLVWIPEYTKFANPAKE